MKHLFTLLLCAAAAVATFAQQSPNGKVTVTAGKTGLTVSYGGQHVVDIPTIGVQGATKRAKLQFSRSITEDYTMPAGKRRHCTNAGNEYTAALGRGVQLVLRLYNDGVAFRYDLTNVKGTLPQELTTFRIPEGTRRWIQHWTDSYEDFYPLSTSGQEPAQWPYYDRRNDHNRWSYPALLQPADSIFALITEANIERGQSASSLRNDTDSELYRVCPDKNDDTPAGSWHTPWRVVIVGTLANVVESTLVTDVSEPTKLTDTAWIQPGVVAWVYWAYNHGSNDYNIICKYVDLAVALRLPYVLIDAEWDEMRDGKTIEDAVGYARKHGVKPLIWYNSSVGWINGAPGPKFRLNKPEDREREFAWCEKIGVAGIKIDFFSGDNQMNMDYCIDLLESAARHHLLVNFHGATLPRGWQRTYPNLLSTEGVYGAEWYNNTGAFTNRAARHNATLPFTRNVVGPMDYTPCAFSDSQHPHITSHAHELALPVLFESGLQHLADRPESFLAQPLAVQEFLGDLPAAWDETRFVSGYPGESVVIARRSGTTWYIAGINGTDETQELSLPIDFIKSPYHLRLYADSGDSANPWLISTPAVLPTTLTCQPRGGFVLVVEQPTHAQEFVMQLRVNIAGPQGDGEGPEGKRTVVPITGGTFEGPLLHGTILPGGADHQVTTGPRTRLEARYQIQTHDGTVIDVCNRGVIYGGPDEHGRQGFYFMATPQFEVAQDSPYAWLSRACFTCAPAPSQPGQIVLNVWKVK